MTYIEELQEAIRNRYHAEPTYIETVPVREEYQGQTVWDGEDEVFDLENASRVYAWAYETDQVDEPKRTVTVLHVPPVTSPELAVRAAIIKGYREQQENH